MKYQAEFRKQYFAKIKDDGYELNGQMFAQMEKDLYIEWLETKLQNTSSNSDYAKCPCCGEPWDIRRNRACKCGAVVQCKHFA